ncbi:MAG: hypothetical protein LBE22_08175, partial [Azoarcus sp.]|nr:hypothetical protein [Azoarcus sp.]
MTHFPPFKRTAIATACAIALGLAVLPLSSAHAEQTINIDSPVTHGVAGNSARGQAEDGWYTYDVTNVLDPNNNTVNINADVGGYVFGSVTTNGASASGNTVNISGGATVAGKTSTSIYRGVRGGYAGNDSMNVTASNNTVNINDAVIEGEDTEAVWGGFARSRGHNATASNNIVNISNADVTEGVVRGGSANSNSGTATAWGNTVNISNATVNGDVTGGSATEVGNNTSAPTLNLIASGNTVNISGNAWVTEDVTGGYAKYGTNRDRVTATNNTVNISGNALVDGHVYGGDIRQYATSSTTTAGAGDAFTGNTLNVLNAGMTVGSVQSFEKLNFTFPSTQT